MENKKVRFPVAAIFYILLALDSLMSISQLMASSFHSARPIPYAIEIAAYLFIAVVLFTKSRNILTVIAAAVPVVLSLIMFNSVTLIVDALLLSVVACCVFSKKDTVPGFAKYMWFVPGLITYMRAFALPMRNFITNIQMGNTAEDLINNQFFMNSVISGFVSGLIQAVAILLFAAWVVFPYTKSTASSDENNEAAPARAGYINIGLHVVLLLITCGIWQFVWIYKTTDYLNQAAGEKERSPIGAVLLSMFVPFYYLYWIYQSAKRIDRKTSTGDIAGICLLLAILIGIVPPIVMQTNINSVATAPAVVSEA